MQTQKMAVLNVTRCLAAIPGVYQEWPGPGRCVAGMGDGISQGRKPFRSEGEVCPLSEGSSGPQPAQPGSLTAAGGCPAPGDQCTTHFSHGRTTRQWQTSLILYPTSITAAVGGVLLSKANIIDYTETENMSSAISLSPFVNTVIYPAS